MAVTGDNLEKDKSLWNKVDNGEFAVVYMTPEVAMEKRGHFSTKSARGKTFMKRLVAVGVDETGKQSGAAKIGTFNVVEFNA